VTTAGTVHVVDDDAAVLQSARWLLESEGFAVETYSSAEDFLHRSDCPQPECVILDLRMPDMDGLQLQEKLARAASSPPIIFLTGASEVSTCARAMKQGAFGFIEKPVEGEDLLKLARQAIEADRRRRRRERGGPEFKLRIDSLTFRERGVMELLFSGKPVRAIAAELGIACQTVAKRRSAVLGKLGVDNEAQLVRLLLNHGFRPPNGS